MNSTDKIPEIELSLEDKFLNEVSSETPLENEVSLHKSEAASFPSVLIDTELLNEIAIQILEIVHHLRQEFAGWRITLPLNDLGEYGI